MNPKSLKSVASLICLGLALPALAGASLLREQLANFSESDRLELESQLDSYAAIEPELNLENCTFESLNLSDQDSASLQEGIFQTRDQDLELTCASAGSGVYHSSLLGANGGGRHGHRHNRHRSNLVHHKPFSPHRQKSKDGCYHF